MLNVPFIIVIVIVVNIASLTFPLHRRHVVPFVIGRVVLLCVVEFGWVRERGKPDSGKKAVDDLYAGAVVGIVAVD